MANGHRRGRTDGDVRPGETVIFDGVRDLQLQAGRDGVAGESDARITGRLHLARWAREHVRRVSHDRLNLNGFGQESDVVRADLLQKRAELLGSSPAVDFALRRVAGQRLPRGKHLVGLPQRVAGPRRWIRLVQGALGPRLNGTGRAE
jgi:hypothetical protein